MNKSDDLIWGNLLHLSFNMWPDRNAPNLPHEWKFHERMYFDDALWLEITQEMAAVGMNMVVLDLGDAVYYASHPEISLPDAWSHDRLKRELARLRNLGLEPIPKLNFSTGHDAWMKEYSRMVSTPKYYGTLGHQTRSRRAGALRRVSHRQQVTQSRGVVVAGGGVICSGDLSEDRLPVGRCRSSDCRLDHG